MAKVELILPKMGESVAEATITSWLIEVGQQIEAEDGVLEIATDKVDSEVPSLVGGTLVEQLYKVGDVVKIGEAVAIIESDEVDENASEITDEQDKEDEFVPEDLPLPEKLSEPLKSSAASTHSNNEKRFFSPLVKSIAKTEGLDHDELYQIMGSGKNGRVTKQDILSYIEQRSSKTNEPKQKTATPSFTPAKSITGENDIIEMDRMRKMIADHMVHSKQVSPHVTSALEIDVTNIVMWRNKVKADFEKREGTKLTFTPIFIEAVAKALRDFPMVNISIDGDQIIVKKDINVGMAVALPSGNLIVPVVKNVDQLNIIGIAKRVNELSAKARDNKLTMEDIEGGTFTMTNIGTFGNEIGTPIINQPEVAILATGAIKKKPAVIETPQGDTIGIRQMMFLSMSYDHRVVDGMLGGSFLKRVADYLEKFDLKRQIW